MRVETDIGEVLITVIIRRVKELEKVFVITAASLRVSHLSSLLDARDVSQERCLLLNDRNAILMT